MLILYKVELIVLLGDCDKYILESQPLNGVCPTVVGSDEVLLPLLTVGSFPPETVAVLVTPVPALAPTETLKLKVLEPLTAMAVELVQVMTLLAAIQVQFAAFAPLKVFVPFETVKPVGKLSVMVIVPEVATVPIFWTVKV